MAGKKQYDNKHNQKTAERVNRYLRQIKKDTCIKFYRLTDYIDKDVP